MPTKAEFAQQLRQNYPDKSRGIADDNKLVDLWLQVHPQDASKISEGPTGHGFDPLAFGLRVVPAALTSEGGPIGALGAGAGETAAQIEEYLLHGDKPRLSQIASSAVVGAIPMGGPSSVIGAGLKGAGIGAASAALPHVFNRELPSVKEVAIGAGLGGVLGAGSQAISSKFFPPKAPVSDIAEKTPVGVTAPPVDEVQATIDRVKKFVPQSEVAPVAPNVAPRKSIMPIPNAVDERILKPGEPMIPAGTIQPAKLNELLPSLQKQPAEFHEDIVNILKNNGGFAEQRRGVQPMLRTQALADQLKVPLSQYKAGSTLNAEELNAHGNALASILTNIKDLSKDQTTDANKFALQRAMNEAQVLFSNYRGATAETGRALNILKAQNRILKTGDTGFIEQLMQNPDIKADAARMAKLIAEAGDDPIKQLGILKQANAKMSASGVYYNSLLSGLKTHERNFIGNTFNMASNLVNPLVAAPVDALRFKAGMVPERSVFMGETGKQLTATLYALPKATERFLFTMKHGFDPDQLAAHISGTFDSGSFHDLPGGIIPNLPSRLLSGADNFFRTLAHEQELSASAYAAALKAGMKSPEQIQNYMKKVMTDESFQAAAEKYAARAVFQEDPGKIINDIMSWKGSPKVPGPVRAAMTFVVPFIKTPANILRQGLEASPVGFGMSAARAGGREGAQGIGRAALGTLALAPIAMLAASGRLSGNGPSDPVERQTLLEQGWQPNSIKIGDTWVKYQLFQPLSVPLAIMANAWDKFRYTDQSDAQADNIQAQTLKSIAAAGASIIDQSFLSGINGLLGAISDPERSGERFLAQSAQGLVPGSGLLRNITQGIDPVVRKPQGITEAVESIIPGLSQNVPAKLTRFGEEAKRQGGVFRRGFLVPEYSKETQPPIEQKLKEQDVSFGVPRARLTAPYNNPQLGWTKGKTIKVSEEDAHIIEQAIGQERKARLENSGMRSGRQTEQVVGTIARSVNQRAIALLKRGEPLSVEKLAPSATRRKLAKPELDQLYKQYLESQK